MPFIPHTETEIQEMLKTIGVDRIETLFDEIPDELRQGNIDDIAEGISEMEIGKIMRNAARQDDGILCFTGAGAYEHHIPAAVWELTTRGEFYTAYTPYQAEASQGTLQVLYEFQSMVAELTAMDVSNSSLYDGATALAEAVLMSVRANRKSKSKRILCPTTVHPLYQKVVKTIVKNQGIKLESLAYASDGCINTSDLPTDPGDIAAVIIPMPNFFGNLEDIDKLTDWAHQHNALVIAVVNPTSLALLKPPGQWGDKGADIACGEGQPLGAPLSSGGPYFGFMCCQQKIVRQMPGRIIGKTIDAEGKPGFTLTLQAREQHIRRSKATSNICTNQGLLTTAATIYLSLLGPVGLGNVAKQCHHNTRLMLDRVSQIKGVKRVFDGPVFHEALIQLPVQPRDLLTYLAQQKIAGGFDTTEMYPEINNGLLICATETKSMDDIEQFAQAIEQGITALSKT